MSVKLLTENHLEFLCLKGGCTGLSEFTLVKMPLLEISCHGSYNYAGKGFIHFVADNLFTMLLMVFD